MTITKFDKKVCREVQKRMEKVLREEFPELQIEFNGGRFESASFTPRLTLRSTDKSTMENSVDWSLMKSEGMDPSKPGRNGEIFTRWNSRAHKMPVEYTGADGKNYKTSVEHAKYLFGA